MIHYSAENTESLKKSCSVGLQVAYLLRNKKEFLNDVSHVEFTTEMALGLTKSELTMKEKATIVSCLKVDVLNAELANEVLKVTKSQEILLEGDLLVKTMSLSTLTEEKICVIGRVLARTEIREDVITDLLNTLPIPYKYMAEKGKKPEIPNTESTRTLVGILKNKGYISTFSETDKGIRVNTKMK
jgi:hypothetical protein